MHVAVYGGVGCVAKRKTKKERQNAASKKCLKKATRLRQDHTSGDDPGVWLPERASQHTKEKSALMQGVWRWRTVSAP